MAVTDLGYGGCIGMMHEGVRLGMGCAGWGEK
jgi:hypothetical protein